MNYAALDGIMHPKAIAVIGASATPGKIGFTVLNNLIQQGYWGISTPSTPAQMKF